MARLIYLGAADRLICVTTHPLAFRPGEVTEVPDALIPFLETLSGFPFRVLGDEASAGGALPVETPEAPPLAEKPKRAPRKKKGG